MDKQISKSVSWEEVSEYIASGNIAEIAFNENLTTVSLQLIYGTVRAQKVVEATFTLLCVNCAYIEIRRSEHHAEGSSVILEAYLHERSTLIEDLLAHKLAGKSGSLFLENTCEYLGIKHLEIIGEISLNILCTEVQIKAVADFPF